MARRYPRFRWVQVLLCLLGLAALSSSPSSSAESTQATLILIAESPQAVEMEFPLEDVRLFRMTSSQLYIEAPRYSISMQIARLRSPVDWAFREGSFVIRFTVPSGSEIRFGDPDIEMPGPGEIRPGARVRIPAEFQARSFGTDGVHATGELWVRLGSESIRVELLRGESSR